MTVYDHVSGRLSELDREVVRHVPQGGNWRDLPDNFASRRIDQIRRSAAAGEGSRSTYYGRLRADHPAYTISTYFNRPGNGCFIHPRAPRLISVREAARLQGFPDSFRFSGKGRSRFMQVGNAVPPPLAYQLGRMLAPGGFVDLFAGCGGISQGFEWAGHTLIVAVDNDAGCLETLAVNGKSEGQILKADLSDWSVVDHALAEVRHRGADDLDLLVGGPPCQGFSTAGKNVVNDPRNRLVQAFLAAVEGLRPRHLLMENVPALLFRRRRPVLDAILRSLESFGYRTDVAVLHAEGYGIPQLRRRLFISGSRDGTLDWPAPRFAVCDPAQRALQPGAMVRAPSPARTVDEAIADLPAATSADPDTPVAHERSAETAFQKWARGESSLDTIVPDPVAALQSAQMEAA